MSLHIEVADKTTYKFDGINYDPDFQQLQTPSDRMFLRCQLNKLLLTLLKNNNKVVSRESLIDEIWNGNYLTGESALTHSICILRKVLSDLGGNKKRIITISKYGYSLKT